MDYLYTFEGQNGLSGGIEGEGWEYLEPDSGWYGLDEKPAKFYGFPNNDLPQNRCWLGIITYNPREIREQVAYYQRRRRTGC